MIRPHFHTLRLLALAFSWAAAAIAPGSARAGTDYSVVPGSVGNSIRLAVDSPSPWSVTAELVSLPGWVALTELTQTPAAAGSEVHVGFSIDPAADPGGRGTLVLALEARDADGKQIARTVRRLPLVVAESAPEVQRSFEIEECCVPAAGIEDARSGRPARPLLLGGAPNPWRGSTAVRFGLPDAAPVTLRVLDLSGRMVWELHTPELTAGYHQISWDGRDARGARVQPGLYFYTLSSGRWRATGKTLLLR